jgi:hypothetical protein
MIIENEQLAYYLRYFLDDDIYYVPRIHIPKMLAGIGGISMFKETGRNDRGIEVSNISNCCVEKFVECRIRDEWFKSAE